MKFTRKASAHWEGTGKEGSGQITTESSALSHVKYSFGTRFDDVVGTNPEELIGAAHAGCYTMQLSFFLTENGHTPTSLETTAKVTFEDGEITKIHLDLVGDVPEISEEEFVSTANKAKESCPVSKVLKAEITLDAKLMA